VIDQGLLAYRTQLGAAATRLARAHTRRRRRRVVFTALVATAALAATATTLAATGVIQGWLGGEAAPPEVKDDFAGVAPQLGYTTIPGQASKVAYEPNGKMTLYATPTKQGGYCIVADVPWLKFHGDGRGYCLKPEEAERPFVAGLIGSGPNDLSVVAGRAQAPEAATITFTDRDGLIVKRALGAGGFFVAGVGGRDTMTCFAGRGWTPEFTVLDAADRVLQKVLVPLWIPARRANGELMQACSLMSPMSDLRAASMFEWIEKNYGAEHLPRAARQR
jgi:hypothetical protein